MQTNKLNWFSEKHGYRFHVHTPLSVREKQSFLTMKVDNDSLLLLHDSGGHSNEEFLLLYDMKKSNVNIFWVKR